MLNNTVFNATLITSLFTLVQHVSATLGHHQVLPDVAYTCSTRVKTDELKVALKTNIECKSVYPILNENLQQKKHACVRMCVCVGIV
jgi:hypothetical protein